MRDDISDLTKTAMFVIIIPFIVASSIILLSIFLPIEEMFTEGLISKIVLLIVFIVVATVIVILAGHAIIDIVYLLYCGRKLNQYEDEHYEDEEKYDWIDDDSRYDWVEELLDKEVE